MGHRGLRVKGIARSQQIKSKYIGFYFSFKLMVSHVSVKQAKVWTYFLQHLASIFSQPCTTGNKI